MNWKEFVSDYFTFTRKERVGLLTVLILIFAIWISPNFIAPRSSSGSRTDTAWMSAVSRLEQPDSNGSNEIAPRRQQEKQKEKEGEASVASLAALFPFDPNSISTDDWRKLGVREKTITTIQKYLAKGGHFYKPDDLKKIYGLSPIDVGRLLPFVKIAPREKEQPAVATARRVDATEREAPRLVDVNTGDSSAFIALPGIGSKLASRIINFRQRLGGFYEVDQVGETYGLPDSTFQTIKKYLRIGAALPRRININVASKDELKTHPYIRWNIANAIVEYRNQHGNFTSVEDLRKLESVTNEIFNKLSHYLTVE